MLVCNNAHLIQNNHSPINLCGSFDTLALFIVNYDHFWNTNASSSAYKRLCMCFQARIYDAVSGRLLDGLSS